MFREDIYQLLKINDYVPAEFVKKAFREFAKENHPDLYPGDTVKEERFKMVTGHMVSILPNLNHGRLAVQHKLQNCNKLINSYINVTQVILLEFKNDAKSIT